MYPSPAEDQDILPIHVADMKLELYQLRNDMVYVTEFSWENLGFLELGVIFIPYCTLPMPKFGCLASMHHSYRYLLTVWS